MEYPNWFNQSALYNFEGFKHLLVNRKISCLQIGAYTGDATEWMLQNILNHKDSTITDVDTWEGSEEAAHKRMDWSDVETVYTNRFTQEISSGKVVKYKGASSSFFQDAINRGDKYDFIYVDGDHTAPAVLQDGMNAMQVLNDGGIIAFDDYTWKSNKGPAFDPGPAIDIFIDTYAPALEVLAKNTQFWVRKR
jgi:predicted O-methyltransferase YrrM